MRWIVPLLALVASPALAQHEHHPVPSPPPAAESHAHHHEPAAQAPAPGIAASGPDHAADAIYGAEAMAAAREQLRLEHGAMIVSAFRIDRLEARLGDGREALLWDAEAWHGGDIDRLWIKSEGEAELGERIEQAEIQALWSHAIGPWFDLQAGVRADLGAGPDRGHLALGVQGLAPYWFEVDAAAFLSDRGDLTARVEAEYDQRITQRLILQPRAEVELAAQDVPEFGIGAGLSRVEAGLRLRYEIVPQFGPYLGVDYEAAIGESQELARERGEDTGGWHVLLGVRAWF